MKLLSFHCILYYMNVIFLSKSDANLFRSKRYMYHQRSQMNPIRLFGYGNQVEELLDPDTYHKYIRPGITSANPLNVNISIAITSLDKISDADMEYTVTFTLYQTWLDERLKKRKASGSVSKAITMDASVSDRMWIPDTYIVNAKTSFIHDVTTRNGLLILYPNGTVIYVLRITSRVDCPMKLFKYPMDKQVCKLRMASWSFTQNDVLYRWNGKEFCGSLHRSVIGMEYVILPQFNVTRCSIYTSSYERILGTYSQLVMEFELERNIGFFVLQTYIPSFLLVMLSWVSFWISVNAVPARVALGITTVLSMTTLIIGVYSSGPKSTSCIKAIDLYVLVCYGFTFCAIIEYAGIHYYLRHVTNKLQLANSKTQKQNNHIHEDKNDNSHVTVITFEKSDVSTSNLCSRNSEVVRATSLKKETGSKFEKETGVTPKLHHLLLVEKTDMMFMIAFPSLFLLFNLVYWWIYFSM